MAARSRLFSSVSSWAGSFARSATFLKVLAICGMQSCIGIDLGLPDSFPTIIAPLKNVFMLMCVPLGVQFRWVLTFQKVK